MSFPFFDRLRALFTSGNIYQHDKTFLDQSELNKIVTNGKFVNFTDQNSLLQQTNLQINRLERYKDFEQMDEVGEITLALDLYADESSLIDPESGHSIRIKAKNKSVKNELESLFYDTLMIDRMLRPLIRYLCKYGDFASEIVISKNRDSVQNLKFIDIYNFYRLETKFKDLIGFYFINPVTGDQTYLHPWQTMHLRLSSLENIYDPYGKSLLDGARKDFKRLRLMEDAALVYRLTRSAEKRVFSLPIGNIPPREIPQYIQRIAQNHKKEPFIDPATGAINERYSPLIQDDDFYLPKRPDGTGPTIETLAGGQNLDDIADIEYFKKKMISALKIPFSRVGLGDGSEDDSKSLSSTNPEFYKAIQWIQREVSIGLKKVAIVHLALSGYSIDDMKNFDIMMTASSAIDELYRIETWNSRADIISRLKDTGMFTNEWILTTFTDLTGDEVKDMENILNSKIAKAQEQGNIIGGQGGGPDLPFLEDEEDEDKVIIEGDEDYDKLLNEDKKLSKSYMEHKKIKKPKDVKLLNEFNGLLMSNELDGLEYFKDKNNIIMIESEFGKNDIKESIKNIKDEIMYLINNTTPITDDYDDEYEDDDLYEDVAKVINNG